MEAQVTITEWDGKKCLEPKYILKDLLVYIEPE